MKKFDVVLGSPPFTTRNITKFIDKAYELSDEWVMWVHQSTILTNDRENPKYEKVKRKIGNSIKYLKFFAGSSVYKATIVTPMVINIMNKHKNSEEIEVEDIINNEYITYENHHQINKWNNLEVFPELELKYEKLVLKYGSYFDHVNALWAPIKSTGKYHVNFIHFGGHAYKKSTDKQYKSDFYVLTTKNPEVTTEKLPEGSQKIYFAFNNRNEAQNFLDFSKTKWARFGLSMMKNIQGTYGEVKLIPWLNWKENWPEEKFEKLIKATPEEIEFVNSKIPDYY